MLVCLLVCTKSYAEFDKKTLDVWLKSQVGYQTVEADFVQTRKLETLNKPIRNKGKLWVSYKDNQFRWDIGEPVKVHILRTGDDILYVDLRRKKKEVVDADSKKGRQFSFLTNKLAKNIEEFEKEFKFIKTETKDGVYYALFEPKKKSMKKRVPYLALGIRVQTNKLALFEMHLVEATVIRTEFTRYEVNKKIEAVIFQTTAE